MAGNFLVVANSSDRVAALKIVDVLARIHNERAAYWTAKQFRDNQNQLTGHQAFISVGGPGYNEVSKDFAQLCPTKLFDDSNVKISTGFNKAIVYGDWAPDTDRAVSLFIESYLDDFVKSIK